MCAVKKTIRADELLVEKKIAESRSKAQAMILARQVRLSSDDVIDKPSRKIPVDSELMVACQQKYVSRGGEKLEGFIANFNIPVENKRCLDIGASTGGFTDCLLQYGAAHVTCIDVGHGQLHYNLQQDKRVSNYENIHVKNLSHEFFNNCLFDIIVCDVSFISLKKVLPIIWSFIADNGILIALIKPQFEADKVYMTQCKGVIRDALVQEEIRDEIIAFACENLQQSDLIGVIDSPIKGADGNREFLFGMKKL